MGVGVVEKGFDADLEIGATRRADSGCGCGHVLGSGFRMLPLPRSLPLTLMLQLLRPLAGWKPAPQSIPFLLPILIPRMDPSSPAFWAAGTLWRPCDPASHHRRGRSWVDCEGCDHADGTPAACLVAARARQRRASRGSPAAPLCAACRVAGRVYWHNGVHPEGGPYPRDLEVTVPDAAAAR